MTSTFKLTGAEFRKIFKRPSIFIMAILLVTVILVSISIFNPATLVDTTIVYEEANTSKDYYDCFYNDENIDSKQSFDNGFKKSDNMINYYKSSITNTNLFTNYHNDIIDTMNTLISENDTVLRNQIRENELKPRVSAFLTAYQNLDNLQAHTNIVPNTKFYTEKSCAQLIDFNNYVQNNSLYTANELVDIYINNHYEDKLNNVLNNGINFVYTTIKGYILTFDDYYNAYIRAINSGNSAKETMKMQRKNMINLLSEFDKYLLTLLDNDFPIIIMEKDLYQDINLKIDESRTYMNITSTEDENINKHSDIKAFLEGIKLKASLDNLISEEYSSKDSKISQIHIPQRIITNIENIKTKVDENKTQILDKIENLKNDESIKNISKEVTNYSLLEKAYNSVVLDKVLLDIVDDYDASEYKKFYGFKFDEFNKYQYRERISVNKYYIDNNVYSNSFITNFTYSQNSSSETNLYDFMYFVMELCTVIIIVFSMMLVCNLITGETESGTIKLLLVRPFRRSKIITAKLFATIFFVMTFMAFSGIITLIGGFFLYGAVSTPILAVLNSGLVFKASPIIMMMINMITLTLDVIFFVFLALMIAILCKNYAASISCSLVLLIINYALNILFGGSFWYTLLPGMNLHMFKYFGNSFISGISGTSTIAGIIQSLLITGIDTSMSLPYSLFIYGVYSLVFLSVSYSVFQKRDF